MVSNVCHPGQKRVRLERTFLSSALEIFNMFKIGLENRDFSKSQHFYIVDAGKKKKKKKNELHLLACSAALGPSGRGHRPSGDALTIYFSCAAWRLPAP